MPFINAERNFNSIGKIYYEDIGDIDKPVIVMQHGDGNSSADWHSLGYVQALKNYRLLLIDYIGYGKSDKVYDPAFYTMSGFAEDTKAILDHLSIKNAIFFGGSMGARLGYELASNLEYSGYFKAFILNGMGASENTLIQIFGEWAEQGGMRRVVDEMNAVMASPFPKDVEQTFLAQDANAYAAANKNPWPAIKDRLKNIHMPVQFICGEYAAERDEMNEASKLITNIEMHIVPGADHAQAYWWASEVAPIMLSFIKIHTS